MNCSGIWFSFLAPAGIPEDARKALVGAIEQAVKVPAITARLASLGILQSYGTPEQTTAEIRAEFKRVSEIRPGRPAWSNEAGHAGTERDLLLQGCRGGARIRHDVVGIEVLAEFGVRGELCVAHAEIGGGGIETQPILAGAPLNLRHTLATQSLVGKQQRRDC